MCTVLQPSAGLFVVRLRFCGFAWSGHGPDELMRWTDGVCLQKWAEPAELQSDAAFTGSSDATQTGGCLRNNPPIFNLFNQHRDSGPPAKIYKNYPDSIRELMLLWFRTFSVLVKDTVSFGPISRLLKWPLCSFRQQGNSRTQINTHQ